MKTILISLFSAATALLLLPACDSKEEQRREKALERQADSLEDQAKAERKAADKKADELEDAAKATREKK
jgi:hypothetical protein